MYKQNKQAFTLVELIVVITILAILGTIAFITLQGYSAQTRDSKRLSDISNIKKSVELFSLNTGKFPKPDESFTVSYSGEILRYQGTVGDQVSTNVSRNLNEKPVDPTTGLEYTYSTIHSQTEYEVLGLYESDIIGTKVGANLVFAQQLSASTQDYPKIDGNYNGIYIKTLSFYVPTPSIINAEIVSNDELDNDLIKSQIVTGGDNLPGISTGGLDVTFSKYEGTITSDSTDEQKSALVQAIQTAYSGSELASDTMYADILSRTGTGDLVDFVEVVVLGRIEYTSINVDTNSITTNYEEPVEEGDSPSVVNFFLESVNCDVETTDLGGGQYQSIIGLSNVCGEDTTLKSPSGYGGGDINYGTEASLVIGAATSEDHYETHTLLRYPVEDIFFTNTNLTSSSLMFYDRIGNQWWSTSFSNYFYEAQAWDEMTAVYNTHENAYVGSAVAGPIITPQKGGCEYYNNTATLREASLNIALIESRISGTKTNNGIWTTRNGTASCDARLSYSSEYTGTKAYRPKIKIVHDGNIKVLEGTETSSVLDIGGVYDLLNAELVGLDVPSGSTFDFNIRFGDSIDVNDGSWSEWLSFIDNNGVVQSKRSILSYTGKRYIQYKINSIANSIGSTPKFEKLQIIY